MMRMRAGKVGLTGRGWPSSCQGCVQRLPVDRAAQILGLQTGDLVGEVQHGGVRAVTCLVDGVDATCKPLGVGKVFPSAFGQY